MKKMKLIRLVSLVGVVSVCSLLIGTQHISAFGITCSEDTICTLKSEVNETYYSPQVNKIEELLAASGVEYYAYMDLNLAQEELKPVILEARNRIILGRSWVSDDLDGRILDKNGNVIEEVPHFSEIFPEDWEIPMA